MPDLNVGINGRAARTGARKVTSALSSIKTSALSLAKTALSPLNIAIGAIGGGLAVGGLIKIADNYTTLNSQLKYVTGSSEDAARAQEDLFKMSQLTGTAVTVNGEALVKLSNAQELMGTNTEENIKILGGLNSLMRKTGVGTQQVSATMLQLTQALGSGKLAGDEFRSIYENAPALMRTFADSMGVPVGSLKDLASQGEITTEVMTKALMELAETSQTAFDELPKTVESGWQRVKNSFESVWVAISSETGIMSWIYEGLIGLSNKIIENKDKFVIWAVTLKTEAVNTWNSLKPVFAEIWRSLGEIGQKFTDEGVTISTVFQAIGTGIMWAAQGMSFLVSVMAKLSYYWDLMKWLVVNYSPLALAARAVSDSPIFDAEPAPIRQSGRSAGGTGQQAGGATINNNFNQQLGKSQILDITTQQLTNESRL